MARAGDYQRRSLFPRLRPRPSNGYRNDNPGWTAAYAKTDVILDPQKAPLETNVPEVFRSGRVAYIVIHSNAVTICVSTLPKRYLLAFASGQDQHGDKRIIDGLWLSFGRKH